MKDRGPRKLGREEFRLIHPFGFWDVDYRVVVVILVESESGR